MKPKHNKSEIFKRAWYLFKTQKVKTDKTFGDCLKQSWLITKSSDGFESAYENHYKIIYWYILKRVRHGEIAEELTQEVFIRLYKHFNSYDIRKGKIVTWLYAIANNITIDYYRTNRLMYKPVGDFVDAETGKETYEFFSNDTTESVIEANELKTNIEAAFSALKPNYRRIAELYFLEDKQYHEIADSCNIPMGTVKGMINRCRQMLQNELKNVYVKRIMNEQYK